MFGCQHLLDVGFVRDAIASIFTHVAELKSWRLRGVYVHECVHAGVYVIIGPILGYNYA